MWPKKCILGFNSKTFFRKLSDPPCFPESALSIIPYGGQWVTKISTSGMSFHTSSSNWWSYWNADFPYFLLKGEPNIFNPYIYTRSF